MHDPQMCAFSYALTYQFFAPLTAPALITLPSQLNTDSLSLPVCQKLSFLAKAYKS